MADTLERAAEDSARGSFFLMSGSAFSTVIMAVQAIIIGNLLGPELYGQYTLAFLIPNVIYLATDLGLNFGITRFVAAYKTSGDNTRLTQLIKRTLLLKFLLVLPFFIIDFVFAGWFASSLQRPFLAYYIQLASIFVPFLTLSAIISSAFVGLDKAEYAAILANLSAIVNTAISVGLVAVGFGIAGSIIGTVVACAATAAVSVLMFFIFFRRAPKSQSTSNSGADFKKMLTYSAPLYVSVLIGGMITYFQYFVLAGFTGNVEIGNYKTALNFASIVAIVPGSISTILMPAFCKLENCTQNQIGRFFKVANKYSALLVAPLAIFFIIFSSQLIDVIYRGKFPLAGEFLAVSCLGYLLVGVGSITLSSLYNGLSDTKMTLKMSVVTLVTLVVLSPVLASVIKAQGVLVAAVVASVAATFYGALKARKRFRVEFDTRSVVKIYLAAALACVPSYLIMRFVQFPGIAIISPRLIGIVAAGLVFLLAYITLVPAMNILSAFEIQKICLVTRKTKLLWLIAKPILWYEQRMLQMTKHNK